MTAPPPAAAAATAALPPPPPLLLAALMGVWVVGAPKILTEVDVVVVVEVKEPEFTKRVEINSAH